MRGTSTSTWSRVIKKWISWFSVLSVIFVLYTLANERERWHQNSDRICIFKCNINNISGTLSIPNHLPQFLIYPYSFLTTQAQNPRHSDDGNYDCGIFVNFQKTFDTKDYNILLKILELYDIRGISSKRFASDLSLVIVSINRFNPNLLEIKSFHIKSFTVFNQ